jgi:hypothetical protein
MDHVSNAASFEAFRRNENDPRLSTEALPEHSSLLDFSAFSKEHPDRFLALLAPLRPEFQEIAIEYYVLHKSQSFIGKTHGFIQTRVWQALRIIEQTIGAFIILGKSPTTKQLRGILSDAGWENTTLGSLAFMITKYGESRSYTEVSLRVGAPVPAIRKVFRPAIVSLLKNKDVYAVAVGAYLRNLTLHASLTGTGLSKSYQARLKRIKTRCFYAPPSDNSPLLSFGRVENLQDTPWCMLEISSENRMEQISPLLREQGKRLFGKKPVQIFAPLTPNGELKFGYIFARSSSNALVRKLLRIRGISEMSTLCNDDGGFKRAVTVPDTDVQKMIGEHKPPTKLKVRVGDFVEILTGDASGYHGIVFKRATWDVQVRVDFPTGRRFIIRADPTSVRLSTNPSHYFWGGQY